MEAGELFGREAELALVDAFIERGRTGWDALVVQGEAGIGKSTLWREAIRRAQTHGFVVLAARPAEPEAKLSFAALGDLLEPVAGSSFDGLPEPQRRALEVALLQADAAGSPAEPRAVAAGLRSILIGLAASSPVLVAVDDAQWLDGPSANALSFALRRIDDKPVCVLATKRPAVRGARDRLEIAGAQLIELERLSLAAIHELLKRRLGRALPRPLLVRLYETSRGNPFFALEIGRETLALGVAPGDPLPVPKDLRRLLQRRLGRLSSTATEALLITAAVAEPTRELLAVALGADPSSVLEEAERAQVVELEGERVRFTHPLYAAAIYTGAPRERRRRLHQRLSEIVADTEERARHLALATDAQTEELAAALEEAAELALRRGAPGVSAELTELALARTPRDDDERRQDRVLDLIDRLLLAADVERARQVVSAELPGLTGARRRVHALLAASDLAMWSSAPAWATEDEHPVTLAQRALEAAGGDDALAARAHTALATNLESDSEAALDHARKALELIELGAEVPAATHAHALSVFARSTLFGGGGLDIPRLEQAIELERPAPPRLISDRSSYKLAQWLKYADDFDRSRDGLEQARRAATDEGDDFSLVNILINRVILECWAGRWLDARAFGDELVQRFLELGWEASPAPHVALVAALTGDVETVRAVEEMAPWDGVYEVIRQRPLGLLALSRGDMRAAHQHHTKALKLLDEAGMREPAVFRVHADAVESAIGAGNLAEATRVTDALERHARKSSIPWNRVAAGRSRALVAAARGELAEALAALETTLHKHVLLPMPFELGRTLLVKGELERRMKQRRVAKVSLERSLAIFDELGASLWSERARAELARLGLRRGAPDELTDTERRVAELAASGLKNHEVAAQLFISRRTVEANLARIYRKLEISSRAELGARLASK